MNLSSDLAGPEMSPGAKSMNLQRENYAALPQIKIKFLVQENNMNANNKIPVILDEDSIALY